ncbi:insulin-like growth factor I [Melanaphis sacchari]|uniref:insulin-like growth factor I n=1 Tax=Melanaphis sacchari TaxID=742174 RepID=UPI000DC13BC7|nr:insulin-like growth factor I [Melanaphis sacchari]
MKGFILVCFYASLVCAKPLIKTPLYDPFWDNLNNHCGSELADELEGICQGKYNELPVGVSQSIVHRRKMGIPLITEECCYNPCTRRTLKEYCAPSQQ